jgi:hypothetical protein
VPPRTGIWFGRLQVEGAEPTAETQILYGPSVDTAYFATLGQRLVRGRWFTAEDVASATRTVVIGEETARRFFPDRDPVGARFRMGDDSEWATVVGVAADVAMLGLSSTRGSTQVYHPLNRNGSEATFLLRTGGPDAAALVMPLLREITGSIDAEIRVDRVAMAETLMRESLDRERFTTTIMATFAALSLLLAAIGLYGVVSQVVGQRTREIGIRVALGARRSAVASMVLRRAGGATLAGTAVGVVLAVGGARFFDAQVVGAATTSPGTYALAAAALMLTALLAAYGPARRAASIDPVEAIRVD